MDSVPFTLFFMVCLIGSCGIMAKPYEIVPAGVWPEWCAERTYCFDKPADYPSPEEIQELYKKSSLDLSKIKQPSVDDRFADNECRVFQMRDTIYMMKDDKDQIRYVLQDPGVLLLTTEVEECKPDQDLEDKTDKYECRQKYQDMQLPVLSLDKSAVELVNIKQGLPVSCSLMKLAWKSNKYECRQKYQDMQLPVLSLDKSAVELVNIKQGLPVSCSLMKLAES